MPFFAHIGVGLIAKSQYPKINVWIYVVAALLLDILSIFFTTSLWISHGMVMALIWSAFTMGIAFVTVKILNSKKKAFYQALPIAAMLGSVVFLHWIFDFIGWPMTVLVEYGEVPLTGTPLFFNDTLTYSLGVYQTWVGALLMELGFLGLGLFLYFRMRAKKKAE